MANESPTLITSLPLTAEAREDLLRDLFEKELPRYGELLVPGHSFYTQGTSHAQARHMLKSLCTWLGIKPGYISLIFESQANDPHEGHRYTIFLESQILRNELLLGAKLAHALVRYLLEERKQIHLMDPNDQLSLVATGTIVFGLGIVTANGLSAYGTTDKERRALLGQMPAVEYIAMVKGFLWQRAIPAHAYENSLAPWVTKQLGLPKPKRPTSIIRQQYHHKRHKQLEKIGIVWVLILATCIGIFVLLQRGKTSSSSELTNAKDRVIMLTRLKQVCDDAVSYNKQYTDISDLQAMRAIQAEELRCKSLDNQLRHAEATVDRLN